MKNLICISLFVTGCAAIRNSDNEYYHRFAVKPSIVERDLGNGKKQETVQNPFEVPILATVDCDNERQNRVIAINSNGNVTFDTYSDTDHNCSVFHWEVK